MQIKPRPDTDISFLEMVQNDGYPIWRKYIDTPDGYIINLFRIPGPRNETLAEAMVNAQTREPIIITHGIISSSECYVMNGPDLSPAYQLANTGKYDLWFLNVRGNSYSRNHNFLEPSSSPEFWQFSFEEMGEFDLTTSVDYIL